jgi:peptide-methionine (S)-S-oxide reductase
MNSLKIHTSDFSQSLLRSIATKARDAYKRRSSLTPPCSPDSSLVLDDTDHEMSCTVALGAGCYFATEYLLLKVFQKLYPGSIQSTCVGFMSPYQTNVCQNPTFEQVCTGRSGHVQVVLVELTDPHLHFEELIKFFFRMHDPTTKFRQGQDRGFQFSSWIFCGDQEQYQIAKHVREEIQEAVFFDHVKTYEQTKVVTNMSLVGDFTPGPDEHQTYFARNPDEQCSLQMCLSEWPDMDSVRRTQLKRKQLLDETKRSHQGGRSLKRIKTDHHRSVTLHEGRTKSVFQFLKSC